MVALYVIASIVGYILVGVAISTLSYRIMDEKLKWYAADMIAMFTGIIWPIAPAVWILFGLCSVVWRLCYHLPLPGVNFSKFFEERRKRKIRDIQDKTDALNEQAVAQERLNKARGQLIKVPTDR